MDAAAEPDTYRGMIGTGPIVPPELVHRDPVWHYTDAAGIAGILSGGDDGFGQLWATAATILNDPEELEFGAKQVLKWFKYFANVSKANLTLRSAINRVLHGLEPWVLAHPAYVVCASTLDDSLSQWRGYAGRGGYAVKIDPVHEYSIVGRPHPEHSFSLAPTWVKVAYTPTQQRDLISGVFDYLLDENKLVGRVAATEDDESTELLVRGLVSGLAAAIKNPKFESEQEVRMIAFPHERIRPSLRGSDRGLIPYLKIEASTFGVASPRPTVVNLPIREVWVGPPRGEAMQQRIRTVRIGLDSSGRRDVKVRGSEIPFIP